MNSNLLGPSRLGSLGILKLFQKGKNEINLGGNVLPGTIVYDYEPQLIVGDETRVANAETSSKQGKGTEKN